MQLLKKSDVTNEAPYFLSYGIESGGLKHKIPVTEAEKMECPAMKFAHEISDFVIGGVKISYDKMFFLPVRWKMCAENMLKL